MGAAFTLREKVILCILAGLVLVGGAWRLLQRAPSGEVLLEVEGAPPEANEAPELITVHLVGAVLNPGVYRVPPDTRLHELIHLAGGFLEDAD
ncbi:MAG TPA: SLBB domain-containing protein [Bacillota bacterium]|nr:SLBB domain-containing protein [Bacillota bacterium]